MPYLSLHVLDRVAPRLKARLVTEFTRSLITVLGKKPEHIHVVIQEVNRDNWGFAGHLMSSPAAQLPATRSRHPAASRRRRPKAERRNGKSPARK